MFATAALSLSESASSGDPIALSNSGTPVDASSISSQEKGALASTGATGEPRLMGVLEGRAFFRFDGGAGRSCFAVGRSGSAPSFSVIACPESFPTEQTPILDQSAFIHDASTGEVRVLAVEGLAGDTVAEVGVIDASANVRKVKVRKNLYQFTRLPESPVSAIVAVDESGGEIYRIDLTKG